MGRLCALSIRIATVSSVCGRWPRRPTAPATGLTGEQFNTQNPRNAVVHLLERIRSRARLGPPWGSVRLRARAWEYSFRCMARGGGGRRILALQVVLNL